MVSTASIQNAMRIFKYNPKATRWIPKQSFKNAEVIFEKTPTGIKKVVTRADGQVIKGNFNLAGELSGVVQKTRNGEIATHFGGTNYDKTIQITSNNGESIMRLTHKNRPQSFLDSYTPRNGINREGNYTAEYNRLRAEVQNTPKRPQWLEDLVKQWNA